MRVFLAGDSLVKDYRDEEFIAGWGQYLREALDIPVVNYAEGGRSSRSFINEGRLDKLETEIAPGDYCLIEFCHNDDDSKGYSTKFNRTTPLGNEDEEGRFPIIPGIPCEKTYLPKETYYAYSKDGSKGTYKWFLKQYIDVVREKGAIPVIVTPPARTQFNKDGHIMDGAGLHGGNNFAYVRAAKQIATETHTPLIDLFEASKNVFESVGEKKVHLLMCIKVGNNTGRWPEDFNIEYKKEETISENTHLNKYGAYVLTNELINLIKKSNDNQLENLKMHICRKIEHVNAPEGL